jgi:hypothetical protein
MRILLLLLLACQAVYGQEEELARVMEDQAEVEDVKEVEEDIHQLRTFHMRPLNLNVAAAEDLAVFPFLSALHIEQLLQYRKYAGKLIDVKELQAIPGWDANLIRKIIPYVTVQETPAFRKTLTDSWQKGRQQLLLRSALTRNAGVLIRYQFNSPQLQYGINIEKDAGENFWQKHKGLSFFSAHVALRNTGLIRTLVIGDYVMNLGQGLMIWQGRAVRKNGMPIMIKRQLPLLMPYRSNDENRYFKGMAVHAVKRRMELAAYISLNGLDANTKTDSILDTRYATSFLNTGYHRNEDELADKNSVTHFSGGAMAAVNYNRLRMAVSSVFHSFSLPVLRAWEPYNLFSARGKMMLNNGLSYHYTVRNIHLFGELALDREGDPAFVNGLMMAADPRLDISLMVRKLSRGYRSFFASAFTESAEPANEEGIYAGLSFKLSQKLVVDAYADHFRFPWLRYRVDAPGTGRDYLAQLSFRPDKKTSMYLRFRSETRSQTSGLDLLKTIRNVSRQNFRFHLQYKFNAAWEWRIRLEFNEIKTKIQQKEHGFIMYSDLFWAPVLKPFSMNGRVMIFETNSYESRLYAYENDVMFYNIVPAFYGKMGRVYVNGSLHISDRIKIFVKISKNFPNIRNGWVSRWQFIYSF